MATARKPCRYCRGPKRPTPSPYCSARCHLLDKRVITASDCWLWTGGQGGNGYGIIWLPAEERRGRSANEIVHRVAWRIFCGPIPIGHDVHHDHRHCTEKRCFNPTHLATLTVAEHHRQPNSGHTLSRIYLRFGRQAFALLHRIADEGNISATTLDEISALLLNIDGFRERRARP